MAEKQADISKEIEKGIRKEKTKEPPLVSLWF